MENNVHTTQSLCDDLRACGINPRGTLFVHSSLKAVGACEKTADTVLDALIATMREGLLILPTHTWDTINENHSVYDPLAEPSCVGVLTNLFLRRPGVVRSLHPTHSVAAVGRDALDYTAGEERTKTPCPRNGCYGRLYDRKAQILFLGCDLTKNTFLHGVEEWAGVSHRLEDIPQQLYIRTAEGLLPCPQNRHVAEDVSRNYGKMEPVFLRMGVGKVCRIGDARSVLCDAVGMAEIVSRCLAREPGLFGHDRAVAPELWECAP